VDPVRGDAPRLRDAIFDFGFFPADTRNLTQRSPRTQRMGKGEFLIISQNYGTRSRAQKTQRPERDFRSKNVGMLESGFRVNVAMRPAVAGHVTAWAGRAYAWTWREEFCSLKGD